MKLRLGLVDKNHYSPLMPIVPSNDHRLLENVTIDEIIDRVNNDNLAIYHEDTDEYTEVAIVKVQNYEEWELTFSLDFWSRKLYTFGTLKGMLLLRIREWLLENKQNYEDWELMKGTLKRTEIGWVFDAVSYNEIVAEELTLAILDEDII